MTTEQKFLLCTRFHPIQHIKEVLDCLRLAPIIVIVSIIIIIIIITVCVHVF